MRPLSFNHHRADSNFFNVAPNLNSVTTFGVLHYGDTNPTVFGDAKVGRPIACTSKSNLSDVLLRAYTFRMVGRFPANLRYMVRRARVGAVSKLLAGLLACLSLSFGAFPQSNEGEDILSRAIELHRAGDIEGAIQAYQMYLKAHPERAEVRSNLGAAYARLGHYEDAIEQYQKALAIDSRNVAIRFNLGVAYYKSGQLPEASTHLSTVLAAQPENKNALVLVADCHLQMGEYKRAIELLTPHEVTYGEDRVFLYLLGTALIRDKQTEKGQRVIDKILRDGDSAEAHLMLGAARLSVYDFPGAVQEIARAIELNPTLPTAHSYYGNALLGDGKREQAVEAFRRELELNPNNFEANYALGIFAKQDREFDKALRYFQRALLIRPGSAGVRYQIGTVYIASDNLPEAQRLLEVVVQDAPDLIEAHASLAKLYYRLKRKDDGDREQATVRKLNAEIRQRTRQEAEARSGAFASAPRSSPNTQPEP